MRKHTEILQSPLFVFALSALLLNDIYLKQNFPGFVTGKLSDFCGLFIFPAFFSVFFPKAKRVIYLFTAVLFIIWKSPYSDGFIDLWNAAFTWELTRVIDYTDLFALMILPFSYWYSSSPKYVISINKPLIICLAAFAFMSTSKKDPNEINCMYDETYFIPAVSRDSLISEIKHSGMQVSFTDNYADRYVSENCIISQVNDSITSCTFTIYNYDYDSMAVKVILKYIEQDSSLQTTDPDALCSKLRVSFENDVIRKLKI